MFQELVDEDSILVLKYQVTRNITDNWVSMTTLLGSFSRVTVPVIKLTAQTGMVMCAQHAAPAPAPTPAPLKPVKAMTPQEIDKASIENILGTGSLGVVQGKVDLLKRGHDETIIHLERSPYLHKRSEAVQPTAPAYDGAKSSSSSNIEAQSGVTLAVATATSEDKTAIPESSPKLETFEVHMARHR